MAARILVVDDEPDLLHAIAVRLKVAGYQCETARNGKEGLAKVAESLPDLIVADLMMPEMNGYEMLQQLKADAQRATIPVIVLTAVADRSRRPPVEQFTGVRIMCKPFQSSMLLEAIHELLMSREVGGSNG